MLLPPTRSAVRPVAGTLLSRGLFANTGRVRVVSLGGFPNAGFPNPGFPNPGFPNPGFPNPDVGHGDYIDGEVIDEQVYGPVHEASLVRRYDA